MSEVTTNPETQKTITLHFVWGDLGLEISRAVSQSYFH